MRFALLMLAVLVTASAQAPGQKQYQTGSCPKTAELEVSPQDKYWFEGVLGHKHVRMYLERGGEGVVGVIYDTTDWAPLMLGGRWIASENGTIEVTARNQREAETGLLKGHLTAGGLVGVWSPQDEQNDVPFRLKAVPQPKCDGNEPWKIFDNANWPVIFSYPRSWHISTGTDSITLTCPDASLMAYEGHEINVTQGAEANNATSDFVQCGDKWIYGYDCKCKDVTRCKTAPATDREGMTILQGDEREWRAYCRGGGYVGVGHGKRRILTFGDTWIVVEGQGAPAELVERLVGTAKRRR
jgi:hypothetical protein